MIENLPNEKWKPIVGYEGLYEISNKGRVKSLERVITRSNGWKQRWKEKILKLNLNEFGYEIVGLYKEGKGRWFRVHRLVAEAFIPNPNNLPQVNHKSENRTENFVENLEWCDNKYNSNYGNRKQRISISNGKPIVQISNDGKITYWDSAIQVDTVWNKRVNSNIIQCCKGKYKQAYGYKWMYLNEYNQLKNKVFL